MKLSLKTLWANPPEGMRSQIDRETFADFSLAAGLHILTSNRSVAADAELEDTRASVKVGLFPLAEFVASNWWALLNEPIKTPIDSKTYVSRHSIERHSDGFAYPHVELYGADSRVQIRAYNRRIASADIDFFVECGLEDQTTFDRHQVETELVGFLHNVADRLSDSDDKRELQDNISAIEFSRSDRDELEYCTLAGLLGCDPYGEDNYVDDVITNVQSILGEALTREIFATAELQTAVANADAIQKFTRGKLQKSKAAAEHVNGLKSQFAQRLPNLRTLSPHRPWERGYFAATELRRILAIDERMPLADDYVLRRSLLDGAPYDDGSGVDWSQVRARGLGTDGSKGFGIAIDPQAKINSRFQLAATFADYLLSADNDLFLSSGASTDRQKANKAFAAEFLAPIGAIRTALEKKIVTFDAMDRVARDFNVSRSIIRYQIENQARDLL